MPPVEAVLTEDGRILETGTWEKVKERAGDKARRLDLAGKGDDARLYRFPQPFTPAPATQWKWTWAGRQF